MTLFFRLIETAVSEKAEGLRKAAQGKGASFDVDPKAFAQVPGSPFAYWVSERVRRLFVELPAFGEGGRAIAVGLQTGDDFRFVRTWWEANIRQECDRWFSFAKGGSYSPFYADIHLVVNWAENGGEIKSFADPKTGKIYSRPQNTTLYFRPGLTWSDRTTKRFSARTWPAGGIFSVKGSAGFFNGEEFFAVGIMNSSAFHGLISMLVGAGDAAARSYQVGVISCVPFPRSDPRIANLAVLAWSLKRTLATVVETTHAFMLPTALRSRLGSFSSPSAIETELNEIQIALDDLAFRTYELDGADRKAIETWTSKTSEAHPDQEDDSEDSDEAESTYSEDISANLHSWVVGVVFGRFDLRLATGERQPPPEPEPFDPLPTRSPGMIPEADEAQFPARAVLVDDPGDSTDLTVKVGSVLERVGFPPENLHTLRRWLARNFFPLHIKMYSKSRRKAPIYWQLATPSASYSVWLYIHAFSRDTLYKVQEIAETKLRHEERKLESLRADFGPNPKAADRKALAAQEVFVEELRTFLDEVKRVAPLWNPDLDDGVIINFAPLWRLVPHHKPWQKELKATWDTLFAGEYDWAHLAMHLWPERVVPKCVTDRSLAIAHGLEDVFWVEGQDSKWKPRPIPSRPMEELVRERTSSAVKAALKSLQEAPVAAAGGRTHGRRAAVRGTT